MIAKTICIVNFKILFDLLNELKNELNFEIIELDIKSFDLKNFNNNNCIFIVSNKNIGLKKKIENQILFLDEFPISLNKLFEKINILFLKMNFKIQSKISVKNYEINLNTRQIYSNNQYVDLTEKEIKLISHLFTNKKPCSVQDLQKSIWEYGENLETHTVETHIYRLRKKIKIFFKDDEFILSNNQGYFIK